MQLLWHILPDAVHHCLLKRRQGVHNLSQPDWNLSHGIAPRQVRRQVVIVYPTLSSTHHNLEGVDERFEASSSYLQLVRTKGGRDLGRS